MRTLSDSERPSRPNLPCRHFFAARGRVRFLSDMAISSIALACEVITSDTARSYRMSRRRQSPSRRNGLGPGRVRRVSVRLEGVELVMLMGIAAEEQASLSEVLRSGLHLLWNCRLGGESTPSIENTGTPGEQITEQPAE